ncbi:MAG TPA: hypothetical protein DEB40_04635 [Elusimicrobia bacterium]|nr:hypothetical protein [Elusimicrobiota bacterium]HBT61010.1 hypothetical protein [Elusimicrobiota bacterium]
MMSFWSVLAVFIVTVCAQSRDVLRASAAAALDSAQAAASLSLERQKAGLIGEHVETATLAASSAAFAAQNLTQELAASMRSMESAVPGGRDVDPLQAGLAQARQQWDAVRGRAQESRRAIERLPARQAGGFDARRKGLDDLSRQLAAALDAAQAPLRAAEGRGRELAQLCDASQRRRADAARAQAQAGQAAARAAAMAAELRPAGDEVKAALELLTQDADGGRRTRVWQKLERFRAITAGLKGQCMSLLGRADEFSKAQGTFQKVRTQCDALKKPAASDLEQARKRIDLAAGILEKIELGLQGKSKP